MIPLSDHSMLAKRVHDEESRQSFVNDFRVHLASQVFPGNFPTFYNRVLPQFIKDKGREPETRHEVRRVMTHDPYYSLWSAMQRNSQEMIWDSVIDSVERQLPELIEKSRKPGNQGSLTLDPDLEIPKYHVAADIHLQPGAYHSDQIDDDVAARSLQEHGHGAASGGFLAGTG